MDVIIWIASGFLALAYIAAGTIKTFRPKERLTNLPWTQEYSAATVKFIGVAELLGGIGVILPWLTGTAPILTPIAAVGLVIIQVLAGIHHIRHHEAKSLPINIVLLLISAFVAATRFASLHA